MPRRPMTVRAMSMNLFMRKAADAGVGAPGEALGERGRRAVVAIMVPVEKHEPVMMVVLIAVLVWSPMGQPRNCRPVLLAPAFACGDGLHDNLVVGVEQVGLVVSAPRLAHSPTQLSPR